MTGLLRAAALALVIAGVWTSPAAAGIKVLTQEEIDAQKQREQAEREREERERDERVAKLLKAVDIYRRAALAAAPGLVEPLLNYDAAEAPLCDATKPPRTHAILVGADDIGAEHFFLEGPANDVDLLATQLRSIGVADENIHVLLEDKATRAGVADSFRHVLDDVSCEDRVIVHFSSHGLKSEEFRRYTLLATGLGDPYQQELSALGLSYDDIHKGLVADKVAFDAELRLFVDNVFDQDNQDLILMLNDDSETAHEIMLGRDLSEYMIAVRNRGAHAIAILDTVNAASASIRDRQRDAGEETSWTFEYLAPGDQPAERDGQALVPGHGEFAVFYAAGPDETTPELQLPRNDPENQRRFGLFSFVVANALVSGADPTPRVVAESIQQAYGTDQRQRPHPVVETSNSELALVAETRRPQSGESAIRILNPTPKRGAMTVDREEVEIEGIVEWPARALGVHIDQLPASLDAEGRFRGKVRLKNGVNRVNVMAVTADSRLHPYTLEFVYEGDRKALEGEGRRIAVIIANQTYGGATGFASLATPFADADALAEILTRKYGFETNIALAGGDVSLLLKDQTGDAIQRALHAVGKAVGQKDTVLVYYAGHGIYEPLTSTAYWVPSDAEVGFEPSYLSADDIDKAIRRMQAGSVILISDSCYSGALIRGGAAEEAESIETDERLQALLRMQSRRSRVIVTSGNNEPVEDVGGQGHSIFARALLTGLEKMEHDAFSARELFDGYILQAVTANADQEPQYRPLEKVGHEGGDFVFVRNEQETATAD